MLVFSQGVSKFNFPTLSLPYKQTNSQYENTNTRARPKKQKSKKVITQVQMETTSHDCCQPLTASRGRWSLVDVLTMREVDINSFWLRQRDGGSFGAVISRRVNYKSAFTPLWERFGRQSWYVFRMFTTIQRQRYRREVKIPSTLFSGIRSVLSKTNHLIWFWPNPRNKWLSM